MPRPARLTPALLGVLGFIAAVGPFATDMYLASFTDIATSLGTGAAPVQLTLTAFFLGMSLGQLCNGPLSDKFGRRPVLLIALGIFVASSVAMVFTPTIELFIGLRLLQGLSGSAGVVIARAIASDLSEGDTAVRALSLLSMVVALGPLLAPPVGGVLATVFDWRGVLAVLAAIAILMFVLALAFVPESHSHEARPTGHWLSAFASFGTLLRDPAYVGYTLAFAFAFAAMMSYISASPFVGQTVLGMSPLTYSLSFAAGGLALVLANLTNARLAPQFGVGRMLAIGIGAQLAAGAGYLVLSAAGTLSIPTFIALAFITTAGAGYAMANASALALSRVTPQTRGAGAALLGATQFGVGAIVSPLVGFWGEDTAVPMAICVVATAAIAAGCATVARRASR